MRERIAPFGRIVALLGIACIVVALAAWLVLGQSQTWLEALGAFGILMLAVSVLMRPGEIKAAITGRQARYGGNALVMSVALIAIVVLVNYLGTRYSKRWDVTAEQQFSLSEQSQQILRGLTEPVQVKLFFTPAHYNRQAAEDMIKEYASRSNKLTYEFIDPDAQRRLAMDYMIGRDGTIIMEQGQRREILFGVQEQDLTGALLKLTRGEAVGVYFLTGHQERSIEPGDGLAYSSIRQVLESENYQVGTVNLAVTDTLPSDLSVLVVADPQRDLAPAEIERLSRYVHEGGRLMVLVEPGDADPFGGALEEYGVGLPDALVIDPSRSFFGDIATPLVDRYEFHQITKDMMGMTSVFPTARPVDVLPPGASGWWVQVLASSSSTSWAEQDYREDRVAQDPHEAKGPLPLAVAIEAENPDGSGGRLVVIGDASFVEDALMGAVAGSVGNVDLFMNSVGWLAEQEELISIRPKQPTDRSVVLTAAQARAIIYSNILFVPLLVLLAGGIVWWKRR
jgi:ABC-type uncharacterized transport system involved in gliding motility auxiliary subunit